MKMTPRERAELLEQRLIDFAVRVVKMLPNSCGGQHFSRQIVRSGSAPALLYAEARGSESQKDFKHKCGIALKELREPFVNLRIIEKLEYAEPDELTPLIVENNELHQYFRRNDSNVEKQAGR